MEQWQPEICKQTNLQLLNLWTELIADKAGLIILLHLTTVNTIMLLSRVKSGLEVKEQATYQSRIITTPS